MKKNKKSEAIKSRKQTALGLVRLHQGAAELLRGGVLTLLIPCDIFSVIVCSTERTKRFSCSPYGSLNIFSPYVVAENVYMESKLSIHVHCN